MQRETSSGRININRMEIEVGAYKSHPKYLSRFFKTCLSYLHPQKNINDEYARLTRTDFNRLYYDNIYGSLAAGTLYQIIVLSNRNLLFYLIQFVKDV